VGSGLPVPALALDLSKCKAIRQQKTAKNGVSEGSELSARVASVTIRGKIKGGGATNSRLRARCRSTAAWPRPSTYINRDAPIFAMRGCKALGYFYFDDDPHRRDTCSSIKAC
jgi:hypothetical protein